MQRLLTNREKLVLFITGGVFIFSVSFVLVLEPLARRYNFLDREIAVARMKLNKYQLLLNKKDYIQKKYNKFASEANTTKAGNDSLVSLLSELETLAKDADVRIIDIRPQSSPGNSKAYKELLVDLRTEGSMEGYLKFIYNTESSLSLLRIEKFQLSAKPKSAVLEGSFSISQLYTQ